MRERERDRGERERESKRRENICMFVISLGPTQQLILSHTDFMLCLLNDHRES